VLRLFFVGALFILILALAAGWLFFGAWRRRHLSRRVANAQSQFRKRRGQLERAFFQKAAATGKPRGLAWAACDFAGEPRFALDRASAEIYALLQVTIQFRAVEGGGMEEVEAVDNFRCATAVFVFRTGSWTTDGRAVFNLEPAETLEHYRRSLEPL
jgi:hypothetical protein